MYSSRSWAFKSLLFCNSSKAWAMDSSNWSGSEFPFLTILDCAGTGIYGETHDGVLLFYDFFIRSNRAIERPENVGPRPRLRAIGRDDIITYLGCVFLMVIRGQDEKRGRKSQTVFVPETKRRMDSNSATIRSCCSVRVQYGVNHSPTKTDGTGL